MKVFMITENDWTNLGFEIANSLNDVGVEAKMFRTKNAHKLYPEGRQAELFKKTHITFLKECDIIFFIHSVYIDLPVNLKTKKVFVFHTGTRYRKNPDAMNKIFNPVVDMSFLSFDLYGMGAKNEKIVLAPVDDSLIKPSFERKHPEKIIVGSYPTGERKIRERINSSMKNISDKFEYRWDDKFVSWFEHLEKKSKCDMIIGDMELQNHGSYGISTIEACMLGCIPIVNFKHNQMFMDNFGEIPPFISTDLSNMSKNIERFVEKNDLEEAKRKSREWAIEYHSYKNSALSMKEIFEGAL